MRFCVRHTIELTGGNSKLGKVRGIPIELELPSDLDLLQKNWGRLADVERQLVEYGVPVEAVHAPDGHLADAAFIDWAGTIVQFAETVGSRMVVLHPEPAAPEAAGRDHRAAVEHVRHLQERTSVVLALETFWGRPRVLTPDEIMQDQLPMVLDTSRLPKPEIAWVLETYHTHIINLHLSAIVRDKGLRGLERKHQPIDRDSFCLDLLDRLQELRWNGLVTLEYMPWLHTKVLEDRKLLERIYGG